MVTKSLPPLVWMDLEMTGLDPAVDEIIEIATVVTDENLDILAVGPDLIIHQEAERFEKMDDWNREHHTKSGLWRSVLESKITLEEAEAQTLEFIKKHVPEGVGQLAGNSIWQDRRFIYKYMTQIDKYLHYRMVDVSSIKELVGRWYPKEEEFKAKKGSHRAMDDILESIEELRHYREKYFVQQGEDS